MNSTKQATLMLYKQLIRECQKFRSIITGEYFLRRVREEFQRNRNVQDSSKIEDLLKRGQENLQLIRRQVTIGNLYTPAQRSIFEKSPISRSMSS